MWVIDERGRVFGRVNLIDAFVGVVLLGLIPLTYGVFLMFRPPIPTIVKVTPTQIAQSAFQIRSPRIEIVGENFREALVLKFGDNPALGFLIQNSRHGEVIVPELPVGTYDLSLSDGGRVLFSLPGGLTITAPTVPVPPAPPPVPSFFATLTVRFVTEPEVLGAVKVGDVDVAGPETETIHPVLTELGTARETTSALVVIESVLGRNSFQVQRPVIVFTGRVRVPVVRTPQGWSFRNRPVKVGSPFSFVSTAAALGGSVINVNVPAR